MSRANAALRDELDPTLAVAECYGPTVQGEGPSAGQPALFVRLSRCNLACPTCDVPFTWDWARFSPAAESRRFSVSELVRWACASSTRLVVITGGEPLLQQEHLVPLVAQLAADGRRVEIETNGTLIPRPELVAVTSQFVVSPKLARFGGSAPVSERINAHALKAFGATGRAAFLFVVSDPAEVDEINELQREFGIDPLWVMPEGGSAAVLLPRLAWLSDVAVANGWRLSGRLHVLARGGAPPQA